MYTQDFLLELGTEELPPKLLKQLSNSLSSNLTEQFSELNFSFNKVASFATPRRLAVLVSDLQCQQGEKVIERKGPALSASEKAVEGFAKSCGVGQSELERKTLNDVDYYYFTQNKKGLRIQDWLPKMVDAAIKKIPITRAMRWGDLDFHFVRPVHWLVMILGGDIVKANIMGLNSGNRTRGMRFTSEQEFSINNAKDYQKTLLDQAKIEVDFKIRRETIRSQVIQAASENNAIAVIDESLLNEVCALVEYPRTFSGVFDERFLEVPEEALISAMGSHQKYFHMVDSRGKLLPAFISVANIESSDLSVIIVGNERVIRPRLTDLEFFWEQDKLTTLESRILELDSVLFMDGLGSMGKKARRIEELSSYIANIIGANIKHSTRAGLLSKTDLITNMVNEFSELQGVMGGYYALNDGEDPIVASAISEHYQPRCSGDTLPSTLEGLCVAIADKVDSIVGIYGIGHKPTGSKDPYALKRTALGLLRMIIESKLELSLLDLLFKSADLYGFDNDIIIEIYSFILKRLDAYYQGIGIDKAVVKAVLMAQKNKVESYSNSVYDWHRRINVVHEFMQDKNFKSLIEINKRIKNILKDTSKKERKINEVEFDGLLDKASEFDKNLHKAFGKLEINQDYHVMIKAFLNLKPTIDEFFDNVMVNDEDEDLRRLRLNSIDHIRTLFLHIADIVYLSK